MTAIIVENKSSAPIQVFVSKYSNSDGNDKWFELQPGAKDSWNRSNWELVAFKIGSSGPRAGVYVDDGAIVSFHDLRNISVQ
jgi:hypothetical protein